ncbi:MAG: hypothetical protein WBM11_13525 [Terriglobales bacterium]
MISFAKHVKDPQLAGRGLLSAENLANSLAVFSNFPWLRVVFIIAVEEAGVASHGVQS